MYLVKTPVILSKLSSKLLVWKIETTQPEIFLTFDDGPIPHLTMEILSILADYEAKATFFCVGENAQRNPQLVQRILNDGHAIGNHSHQHISGWDTPLTTYVNNVHEASKHISSKLFRPPYGQINYQQIKELKNDYRIIMWSVLSGDFDKNISPQQCLFHSLQAVQGDIIVFHDNHKAQENMLYALPRFLEHFTAKGFRFSTLKNQFAD